MINPEKSAPGKVIPLRPPSTMQAATDEVLVAACGLRDPAAMGELFDRYADAIYRFLSRLMGASAWDLDDMVHTTFVEAFRGARRFRGRSSVRTWLFGIAANVGRHHIRSEARRRSFLKLWSSRDETSGPRPDHEAERRQMVERLAKALSGLPFNQRVAFVLCDLEEMPGAEAAETLDVRPGTLGRRLFEARRALRSAVEEAR